MQTNDKFGVAIAVGDIVVYPSSGHGKGLQLKRIVVRDIQAGPKLIGVDPNDMLQTRRTVRKLENVAVLTKAEVTESTVEPTAEKGDADAPIQV